MTKKEMFDAITNKLKENGKAVCVKEFGYELRCGLGFKAYEIKYDNQMGALYCYPWAGANVLWRTDFFRMNKSQIQIIYDKTMLMA